MTLEELRIVISASTEPLRREMGQVRRQLGELQSETNRTTSGMHSSFKKLVGGIIALKIGQKIGQAITSGIREAMNVEASLQQIKRIMGESTNQFLKWANTQAIAFNMSKGEAIKYGSVFGNLLMTFTKSSSETMKYTEDLLKASSVIASATGRSMTDVMERIRSGLLGNTEAIEDLGVNVNVAMIQSTEAFKKFANGKSWDQLSFQTQQQIRLMAILEQTSKKYGDTVNQNTSSQLQQLVANLNNVKLSLGQAFLPIVRIVLPVLTSLAQQLSYVMGIVAQFSEALFGKSIQTGNKQAQNTQAQAKAMTNLGNATEKAGKQAKGALAGFDEINSVGNQQPEDSGSSGTGGGIDTSTVMPAMDNSGFLDSVAEVSAKVKEMADKVKEVTAELFSPLRTAWDKYGPGVIEEINAAKINTLATFENLKTTLINMWENGGKSIVENIAGIVLNIVTIGGRIYNEFIFPIVNWFIDVLDPKANEGMQNVLNGVNNLLSGIKDLTSYLAGDGFKYVQTFLALFTGWKAATFVFEMGQATLSVLANTKAIIAGTIAKGKDKLETLALTAMYAKDFVVSVAKSTVEIMKQIVQFGILSASKAADAIKTAALTIATNTMKIAQTALNLVMNMNPMAKVALLITGLVTVLVTAYNKSEWFRNGVNNMFNGLKDAVTSFKTVFSNVFGSLWSIVKSPLNLVINGINKMINGLNKISFDMPNWSWLPNNVQGKSFGIHIPPIPALAQGGYIGANSPVLAMVGDNKHEGEIIAPESKIYEQTYRAIKDALGSISGNDKTLVLNIIAGNSTIARIVIESLNEYAKQHGDLPISI